MSRDEFSMRPDFSEAGQKSSESDEAVYTWFGPIDEPAVRFRYAVIKEEGGQVSIQPGEGRFKKGLKAWRYASEEAEGHAVWLVVKTRHNRIDLKKVDA